MKRFFVRAKALLLCLALAPACFGVTSQVVITDYPSLLQAVTNGGAAVFGTGVNVTLSGTELEVTNNLILDGTDSAPTITGVGSRIFHVHTNASLTLLNLTVTGGASSQGGAIYNEGTLVISNCLFSANSATNDPGAAGADGSSGGNIAGSNGRNGGSASGGALYSLGTLQVAFSIFSGNAVAAGNGGNGGNGASSFVFGGSGGNGGSGGSGGGGAIFCAGGSNLIFATEFVGNSCVGGSGGAGGAVAAGQFPGQSGASGKSGGSLGGAVEAAGPLYLTNCVFASNSVSASSSGAAEGGGLELSSSTMAAYIENATFFENSCQGTGSVLGGGLASSAALAQLRNCTLSTNTLTDGATAGWDLVRVAGTLAMGSTILAGDTTNVLITIETNVLTLTNIVVTTNFVTNLIIFTNFITNISTTLTTNVTSNTVATSGPNCTGGVTDLGYNISSDESVLFTLPTSVRDTDPMLDSALSSPNNTVIGIPGASPAQTLQILALLAGSPAIGVLPGIPGISFPATDGALLPRGTPACIGAAETDSTFVASATAPVISQASSPQTVNIGATVVFQINASGNVPPVGYQWQFNGTNLSNGGNISGAWSNTLTLARVSAASAGVYAVIVGSSAFNPLTTNFNAVLTINIAPSILVQPPATLHPLLGSAATLSVSAAGGPAPVYQWRKNLANLVNGGEISGATSNVLSFSQVTPADDGSYSVLVSNANGTVASATTVLTVTPDTVPPTVAVSTPLADARTRSPVLNGTAADNVMVTNVLFSLTNLFTGAHTNGTAALTPANGPLVNWSIALALSPGTNILTVQSVDYSSNASPLVSRAFFYKVPATLGLKQDGNGSGFIVASASVIGDPIPADGAELNLGEGYGVTAVTNQYSLFSNWVISAGAVTVVSNKPALNFIMQSNLVLTAGFATNIFLAAAGEYNGLFFDTNAVTEETAGMLGSLILGKTGVYSGRLWNAGKIYPLSGSFDFTGHATKLVGPATAPGGQLTVDLIIDSTTPQILGTVSNTLWSAALTADLAASDLPTAQYTILFPPLAPASNIPPGDGYAAVTSRAGLVVLTGRLADGTVYDQVVPASAAGDLPIFASLYANTGLLLGWINLTNLQAAPPANVLVWIKPSSRLTPLYTNGFTNLLAMQGSLWTNPPARTPAIFLTNGQMVISNASLALDYTNVSVSVNNTLVKGGGFPTNSLEGVINPRNGLLTITFGNGNSRAVTLGFGAVLQNQTNAGGFFLTTTNAGAITLQP